MKQIKILLVVAASLLGLFGVYWVLHSEHAVVFHPKGQVAQSQLHVIWTNILLMLVVIVPTAILFLWTAWKFRAKNTKKVFDPDHSPSGFNEFLLWLVPAVVVFIMALITWDATHKLDPFLPLESEKKPIHIQVVAIDWKWLFIYPEQGIATVNFVQFPEKTPIRFALCADHSPMNSFWIPSLSGQIYSMTGMTTVLHMIAHGPGEYMGKAAEINGAGYAGMTFTAKSCSEPDFEAWVQSVKKLPMHLDATSYEQLLIPSIHHPVTLYGHIEKNLYDKIVMKPMAHH